MSEKKFKTLARLISAIRPEMENLEGRQMLSASASGAQSLPYVLDFSSPQPGVLDKNNMGTGFTLVQPNRLGTQYQPSLVYLNTAAKELDLTTQGTDTSGSNYGTDNTMVNGLETKFDGTTSGFTITTRLKGPLGQMNANYESAGIFFGPDQDNYVKLVAEYSSGSGGQVLQFTDEQNGTTHTVNTFANIGSFANITTLDLRLTGNAANGTVTASYSVNGGAYASMPGTLTLSGAQASAFFNATSTAGITAVSKNSLPAITIPFGHFEIDAGQAVSTTHPSIRFTTPANNATGVSVTSPIAADLNLPNSAISAATISNNTVYLVRASDQSLVPAVVNTSGGGDSIILTPTSAPAPNTQYTFVVTAGVTDTTGSSMVPFSESFTTGAAQAQVDPSIKFNQVNLPTATGAAFTCVKIGPDGLLYASTEEGKIFRWVINSDGTLQTPQVIDSLQQFNGGKRLITGFAFDPSASPSSPVLWVSNSYYALSGATTGIDFTGAISVMSGTNLANVRNAVTNLPRSVADHSTEQPIFGPGPIAGHYYLYFAQASNTAYGAPDTTWGGRSEHLLTAAILRLDTTALNGGTLNALTPDVGGSYNPFASTAPLIIYATGVRNAFSLLWTANGQLLAPNNGSSAGGNTPAYSASDPQQINGPRITPTSGAGAPYSGPDIPGLPNVKQTESDFLYNITQGGYYGHPNATRGEFVLNGGNPTTGGISGAVFAEYPSGTNADSNYKGFAWDFGPHASADGIIEYQDKTFGGKLQNAIFVTEYSAGSDIVWLKRDANGNIISATKGISGFSNLNNPVSLVEDTSNGNIYVSELGGQRIVLLKPVTPAPAVIASKSVVVINGIAKGYTGAATSGPQSITITNTGTTTLNFAANGAFTIVNDPSAPSADAATFAITNASGLPATLAPGASMTVNVAFTAAQVGAQYARLQVASDNPSGPLFVTLHGIGTTGTGGANEPSLPAILRAYNIPTITGDGVNDANMNQTFYPANPDASSQEVAMQRLTKAGNGPVTIQILASFNAAGAAGTPLVQFGYYTAGSTSALDKTQIFSLAQSDAQTTNPTALGGTAFDPGSATFGLYSIFPHFTDNGKVRISYSEDALNTWDANVPRKVRFFPLKNADGSTVPNAYVFAFEDNNIPFGAIQPYDSNDVIAIIRNVKAAGNVVNAAAVGIENTDGAPAADRVVFNRIEVPNPSYTDAVHDKASLLIRNTGSQPLSISSLVLSDSKNWSILSAPTQPLAPGATGTITIQFIAHNAPAGHTDNVTNDTAVANDPGYTVLTAAGIWTGTLTINTNDPATPSRAVTLAGYWQHTSEHEEEPGLQAMINTLFGYKTNIASTYMNNYPEPNGANTFGEEVVSAFWNLADTTQQATVLQLAAFHQQYDQASSTLTQASFGWYTKGNTHTNYIMKNAVQNGQALMPLNATGGPSYLAFSPATSAAPTFGFSLDGNFSDDTRNTVGGGAGHHVRFYPLRDGSGNIVPNSYLAVLDYGSVSYENYDFQDNVYLITNIRPAGKTSQPPIARASAGAAGGINVQWAPISSAALSGYNVYRSTTATGIYTKLTGSPVAGTSFFDAQAPAGTLSFYKITAVDGSTGESLGSTASASAIPAAPTGLTVNALTAGSTRLTWNTVAGATLYHIERQILGGNGFVEIATSATVSFTDTGLNSSTNYVYQVRAENTSGFSPYSGVASTTTPSGVAPGMPTGLKATLNSSNQAVLTWAAPSGTVTGYHIERQAQGESKFTEIAANVTTTTFTDTGVLPSTSYTYRVRAENAGTLGAYTTPNVTLATGAGVAAPTGLGATVISSTEVDLKWTAASGTVTLYHVERQDPNTLAWAEIGTTSGVSYPDSSAQGGMSYNYRVRSERSGIFSSYAGPVNAVTPVAVPSSPATVSAKADSASQVTVTWSAVSGATGYVVQRQVTGSGSTWTTLSSNWTSGTSYVDNPVQASTQYTYQIAAKNSSGASPFTQAQPVTTPAAIATYLSADINATPAGNTVTNVDGSSYDVTAYGVDIGSTSTDSFRFVYQQLAGNFDAVVQVQSLTNTFSTAKAGLMARSTLDAGSPMIFDGATAASSFRWLYRTAPNATPSFNSVGSTVTYPNVWLRLTRGGNTFTGYSSTDGMNWVQTGTITLNLGTTIYLGTAVSSHNTSAATTAQLRSLSVLVPPAAPVLNTPAANSSSAITLNWNSVTAATSYTVLRSSSAGGTYAPIATGVKTTTYQDGGLANSTTYYYEVIAVNSVGSSSASNSASATTQAPGVTPPAAPTNVSGTSPSPTEIDLTWSAPTGAASYTLQRSSDNGASWTPVVSNWAQTSYQDKTVTGATSYQYEVIADNAGGSSPASAPYTISSQTPAPAAPTIQSGSSPSSTEIDLTWSAPAYAATYSVQRSKDNGATWQPVVSNWAQTSYQDMTVAAGTTYQYQVIAVNSAGSSPASKSFTVRSQTLFQSADIATGSAGSTTEVTNDSAYNVTAGGTGIYNTADSFRFVYTQITGDFDIMVQVSSLSGGVPGAYPQAGLMARATLDASSPEVAITASPVGGYRSKYRANSGDATTQTQTSNGVSAAFPNSWVRIRRVGNVFTTFYGANGTAWTTLGTVTLTTLSSTQPIFIGMAVASNSASATTTAMFQNFAGA